MKPEFTDEEDYLIAYYRDESTSSVSRIISADLIRIVVSITFLVVAIVSEEFAWGLVAFGLLILRQVQSMLEVARYHRLYRSIIRKYEAAVESDHDLPS